MPIEEKKTIGMDVLREHVRIILRSGNVEHESPLSTLIAAHPERGKTTEVIKFNNAGSLVFNDFTAWGLEAELGKLGPIERNLFHHIVIPDLERISARSRTVRRELLATLQIAMQEGLSRVRTHETDLNLDPPMRLGVIMCTTPRDIQDGRSVFKRLSFLSRLIPFSFEFSPAQKVAILKFIEEREHLSRERMDMIDVGKTDVSIPKSMVKQIDFYAKLMSINIENFSRTKWVKTDAGWRLKKTEGPRELVGTRAKEELLCYLKSIALNNRRSVVADEDFEEFETLFRHFNFDMNELEFVS